MKLTKSLTALIIALLCLLSSFAVNAEQTEENDFQDTSVSTSTTEEDSPCLPEDEEYIDILILGNSLVYFNEMDTVMFPEMCLSAGKKVRVTSITESGTTLYRLASEKTEVGRQVAKAFEENTYDYVVIEPSRRVTPFEYTVYREEREAALKLNEKINAMGAKTLILAEPGLNTELIPVYTMKESKTDSITEYSLPMDRNTHSRYVENLCDDLCKEMTNAEVVRIGAATEVLLTYFPNYNSLYRSDNRHPSIRGSYLQAVCIYSTIFKESYVGQGYTNSLYDYNALIVQRAAAVAVLCESESIMLENECERVVKATLDSNTTAVISWNEPKQAEYYEIYRKTSGNKYALLGKTISNECEYFDDTLKMGKEYFYKIKAVNKVGDLSFSLDYSSEDSVKTLEKPKKPTLTLKNKNTAIINIKAVKGAKYYNIYRLKNDSPTYHFVGSTSKLKFIDDTLKPNNTYTYKICAVKQSGKVASEMSNGAKIVSLKSPKISLYSVRKRVKINISEVKGASSYAIYVKESGASKYKLLATTSKTTYNTAKLSKGKTYYFQVRAYKDKNTQNNASTYRTRKITVK